MNPMRNRVTYSPAGDTTAAEPKTKQPPKRRRRHCRTLGPNRSQSGPMANRRKTVPSTEMMAEVCATWKSMPLVGSSTKYSIAGTMENHPKKARKKLIHEKWNPRYHGRAHEHTLKRFCRPQSSVSAARLLSFIPSGHRQDDLIITWNYTSAPALGRHRRAPLRSKSLNTTRSATVLKASRCSRVYSYWMSAAPNIGARRSRVLVYIEHTLFRYIYSYIYIYIYRYR